MKEFTNLYPLSKTLRFELKPIGKTLENIEKKGLIKQDEKRAEDYKVMKEIIDEYHKHFITESFANKNSVFEISSLNQYEDFYRKPNKVDKDNKEFDVLKEKMRKTIYECFNKNTRFNTLFKKELIKNDLLEHSTSGEREIIEKFRDFTTYFTGFHKNRANIYSKEEKSTAIAYRLIHENLPKYIDNIIAYEKIKERAPTLIEQLNHALEGIDEVAQGRNLDEIFSISYYNNLLTQLDIDIYNTIIGGRTEKDKENKIQGLNETINLYNQQQKDKKDKLPKFKILFKQILSDRESTSFIGEEFESDNQLLETIEQVYSSGFCNYEDEGTTYNLFEEITELLMHLHDFDLSKIYIRNDTSLTDISQKIYGDWNIIRTALTEYYEQNFPQIGKESIKKFEERKTKFFKQSYYSVSQITQALEKTTNELVKEKEGKKALFHYFSEMGKDDEGNNAINTIHKYYAEIKELLNTEYPSDCLLSSDKENVAKIKLFLDSIMNLSHFIKVFHLKTDSKDLDKDIHFYALFDGLYNKVLEIIPLYNMVRNHLTKKPYSTEKFKLNFENSTLLDGWDVNKEKDNTAVLLKKDDYYFLAVMDKKHNRVFERDLPVCNNTESAYEKMNYKLLPGANKMLPKVFLSRKGIETYKPSNTLLNNYEKGTHKKGDNFNKNDMYALIDYFKKSIMAHPDWKDFNHIFSDTKSYEDLSGFYREVEHQGYKISFTKIDESYINDLVNEGKIYLFQIYNKDFSKYSKGKPNLHTLYWKALFDENNLKNIVYKLNGEAEIFYRRSSIKQENLIIHKANNLIENKNPLNKKQTSKFPYDIIKNKRFSCDKFQFHVPISMNFKAVGRDNINQDVLKYLKGNKEVNIIGIDRGERHLLYLTLINQNGDIIIQESLNLIDSGEKKTDYKNLLKTKEDERLKARKDWGTIENIKELKSGYLSQIVHKISKMMVEYNAIVVLEDLNFGFKRGRQKVERQVYQKFEKMLIDKLNYLVFKDKKAGEPGSTLSALQLTSKFDSFKRLGKQSGFLFYLPAWNTSKIDPTTGFVSFLRTKYENIEKAKAFFNKFENVIYNNKADYFVFNFDYTNFTEKAEGSRTKWKICTHGKERYYWNKHANNNKGASEIIDVTDEIKKLFIKQKIDYTKNNLIEDIVKQEDKNFFQSLMWLLGLTLSMRQSKTGTDIDFILSPVANEKGEFFDSRNMVKGLPKDADANGAYHIALKGLWCLQQIHTANEVEKIKHKDLAITNKEWLSFVQEKAYKKEYAF
jgi:CRISPR-associated protein Cpf1